MITLSNRLQTCASLVTGKGIACDVGTDHAYLAAYLVQSGRCAHVIASDIVEGPLRFARQTLEKYHLTQQIQLIQSDGLAQIPPEGVSDVILAGMGAETICEILEAAPWLQNDVNLILQPMSKHDYLRMWLADHAFALLCELPAQDDQVYTILQASYTGERRHLSPVEALLGALDLSDPLAKAYVERLIRRQERVAEGLAKSGQSAQAACALLLQLQEAGEMTE